VQRAFDHWREIYNFERPISARPKCAGEPLPSKPACHAATCSDAEYESTRSCAPFPPPRTTSASRTVLESATGVSRRTRRHNGRSMPMEPMAFSSPAIRSPGSTCANLFPAQASLENGFSRQGKIYRDERKTTKAQTNEAGTSSHTGPALIAVSFRRLFLAGCSPAEPLPLRRLPALPGNSPGCKASLTREKVSAMSPTVSAMSPVQTQERAPS